MNQVHVLALRPYRGSNVRRRCSYSKLSAGLLVRLLLSGCVIFLLFTQHVRPVHVYVTPSPDVKIATREFN